MAFFTFLVLAIVHNQAQAQATARLTYAVKGVTATIPITEQVFGTAGTVKLPTPSASANYSGMWWGGQSQNGWGINVTHQPGSSAQRGGVIFATLFVYDIEGKPTWMVGILNPVVAGNNLRWDGKVYSTTSSGWLGGIYDAKKFAAEEIGVIALDFN